MTDFPVSRFAVDAHVRLGLVPVDQLAERFGVSGHPSTKHFAQRGIATSFKIDHSVGRESPKMADSASTATAPTLYCEAKKVKKLFGTSTGFLRLDRGATLMVRRGWDAFPELIDGNGGAASTLADGDEGKRSARCNFCNSIKSHVQLHLTCGCRQDMTECGQPPCAIQPARRHPRRRLCAATRGDCWSWTVDP